MSAAAASSAPYLWWLVSRASGIVALGLVTLTVLVGLTMSTKLLRRPGIGRTLVRLHEHLALVGLGAIAAHGLALLGDPWLHPGVGGLSIPFALSYRPLFTGLGVIAGYLAALLGLSFYARRRIGVRVWRRLHRATHGPRVPAPAPSPTPAPRRGCGRRGSRSRNGPVAPSRRARMGRGCQGRSRSRWLSKPTGGTRWRGSLRPRAARRAGSTWTFTAAASTWGWRRAATRTTAASLTPSASRS